MELGNPSTGEKKQRVKKKYFHIVKGAQIYRILPPMGNLAKTGVWSKYYEIHFGHKTSEGNMVPFLSCEEKNRKTRMIEVEDPIVTQLNEWKKQKEAIAEKIKKAPAASKKTLEKALELVEANLEQFSLEKRNVMNVINDKGEIGLLSLKYKEKLALDEARKKIQEKYKLDPMGIEGCYLEFTKTGKGIDTLTVVTGAMIVNDNGSENLRKHTVGQDIIGRLKDEAFELDNIYATVTPEQAELILKAKEKGMDQVFPPFEKKAKTEEVEESELSEEEPQDLSMEEETTVLADGEPSLEDTDEWLKSIGAN
jgi:hypothetical protein